MSDDTNETPANGHFGKPRQNKPKITAASPQTLLGADVEVRTTSGLIVRGELAAVRGGWATVEQHSGRLAIVRVVAIQAITREGGGR